MPEVKPGQRKSAFTWEEVNALLAYPVASSKKIKKSRGRFFQRQSGR